MKNLLVTGAFKISDEQKKIIEGLGYNVYLHPDESYPLEIDSKLIDGVICNNLFTYAPINNFKNLRFIQLTSAGTDRLDMDYAARNNIRVYNAKGVYSIPMSEFAVGGILQLYKNFAFFNENKKSKTWCKDRNLLELYGKRACVIGTGSVGSEIAKRLNAFGVNVYGIDLHPRQDSDFVKIMPPDSLSEYISQADIVILSLPLTERSFHFFGKTEFDKMKPGSVFVNIARGTLTEPNALIDVLKSGKLCGAVLDVFEEEPLDESSPLWDMENVVLTPHNSFVGENNNRRLFELIVSNLKTQQGE